MIRDNPVQKCYITENWSYTSVLSDIFPSKRMKRIHIKSSALESWTVLVSLSGICPTLTLTVESRCPENRKTLFDDVVKHC